MKIKLSTLKHLGIIFTTTGIALNNAHNHDSNHSAKIMQLQQKNKFQIHTRANDDVIRRVYYNKLDGVKQQPVKPLVPTTPTQKPIQTPTQKPTSPPSSPPTQVPTDNMSPQEIAHSLLGYGSDYDDFAYVVSHESGWRVNAKNPSGAYGIGQAFPGNKMASEGSDWATSALTQIKWTIKYMNRTYGSIHGAYEHWIAYHSY